MKIATFNINNINKRLANLLAWLAEAKPDVVCLQELKAEQAAFPVAALRDAGYSAVWRGQKSCSGKQQLRKQCAALIHIKRGSAAWAYLLGEAANASMKLALSVGLAVSDLDPTRSANESRASIISIK